MAHDLGRSPSNLNRRVVLGGVGATAAVALSLGSLGRAVARAGTPVASGAIEDYPEVVITATEYRLDLPASIPAGLTRVTLNNEGAEGHDAMFLRVNDGASLADLQAALKAPDFGPIFALSTSFGGTRSRRGTAGHHHRRPGPGSVHGDLCHSRR